MSVANIPYNNRMEELMARPALARILMRGALMRHQVNHGLMTEDEVRQWFKGYVCRTSQGAFVVGYLFFTYGYEPNLSYAFPEDDGKWSEWRYAR